MDKLLTINQFTTMNNCGRSTVYRENKAGRLPFTKIGRATRINRQCLTTVQARCNGNRWGKVALLAEGGTQGIGHIQRAN
jgi:excisionase family DNA binding protein